MEADGYVELHLRPWYVRGPMMRVLYAQTGTEPSLRDPLIGGMESSELAQRVVEDHNASLEGESDVPSSYRENM